MPPTAMATVKIVDKQIVKPAWAAPESSLFLSAVDIMCRANPHNRRLLFYHIGDAQEYAPMLQRLKESLSVALAHFYPLAGRLRQPEEKGGRLYLDCCDSGAEVVEACVEGISFEDLQRSGFEDTQPLFTQLTPWIDPADYAIAPPLCVQVSRFERGSSIALGIAHSHVVCDGTSLWHFMTAWAECARGQQISLPPIHTRTFLQLQNPSSDQAFLQKKGPQPQPQPNSSNKPAATRPDDDGVDLKLFHFEQKAVRRLKEKAGGGRTSYEALCAHIWKHTSSARGHARDEDLHFIHIVNMRNRLDPQLPAGYFGNALMWVDSAATAGELEEEGLDKIADRIHGSIASCDDSAFKGWLHWLEVFGRDEIVARYMMLDGTRIRASSSHRSPVFGVDFGWGAPAAVRCAATELCGKIIFFPGVEGFGSIDMSYPLPRPVMQSLASDCAFTSP